MRSAIRRLVSVSMLALVLVGLTVGSAEAAVTPTTSPATSVTQNSAALNGSIDTAGFAVLWQFQYGKTTAYGQTTSTDLITAGKGTVDVAASIKGLASNTTYHFRLRTQYGSGTTYYPLVINNGQDRTFTTNKTGSVTIAITKLTVKKNIVSLPFKCASKQTCKGKLTLTDRVRSGKHFKTITFASNSFTIKSNHKSTLKPKLSKTAIALLKKARKHTLTVTLTAKFTTGQPKFTKKVTLVL